MFKKAPSIALNAAGLLASVLLASPAQADPQSVMDVFSKRIQAPNTPHNLPVPSKPITTAPSIGAGPGAMMSQHTPIVAWFEKFDDSIFNALPTPIEKLKIDPPMDKEVERVRETTDTMNSIAKRYRRIRQRLEGDAGVGELSGRRRLSRPEGCLL